MCDQHGDPAAQLPLHQFWWLHDARWYQGVAQRFGQDVANEINAEALQFVARRVAAWHRRAYGTSLADLSTADLVELLRQLTSAMWPDDMLDVEYIVGDDGWETVISDNFVLKMLRAARSIDGYECACLAMRAGWYAGLGISVRDRCVECRLSGGSVCRFLADRQEVP